MGRNLFHAPPAAAITPDRITRHLPLTPLFLDSLAPLQHLYRLGSMTQRLVVSPDVGSLLQRCAYERASKA